MLKIPIINGKKLQHRTSVRKIPTNRRSSRGYYSFRGVDCVAHESTVERDFVMRMEFDEHVEKVVSQPIELSYIDLNGRTQRYTPDYLVYFKTPETKPMLVEVKEREELLSNFQKLKPKFAEAFAVAKQEGWTFKIYDERRIHGVLLDNIRKLRNYSVSSVTDEAQHFLLDSLNKTQLPITVKQFLESCTKDRDEYLQTIGRIWWLARHHLVYLDLSSPLSQSTQIVEAKKHV